MGICGPPLALVGLRRPPPLHGLRLSLHGPRWGICTTPIRGCPGPRFAPPLTGGAPGGSSTRAPPPQFSSAPPGTPRDSGSEDSDSDSSSASTAPVSSPALLA